MTARIDQKPHQIVPRPAVVPENQSRRPVDPDLVVLVLAAPDELYRSGPLIVLPKPLFHRLQARNQILHPQTAYNSHQQVHSVQLEPYA